MWPPRLPSQESEGFNPFQASSLEREREVALIEESFDSEVFESEGANDVVSGSELINAISEKILGNKFKHLLRQDLRYSLSDQSTESSAILTETSNKINEDAFRKRIRVIKVEGMMVETSIKKFTVEHVDNVNLNTSEERLKEIRTQLAVIEKAVLELVLDLEPSDSVDTQRITDFW